MCDVAVDSEFNALKELKFGFKKLSSIRSPTEAWKILAEFQSNLLFVWHCPCKPGVCQYYSATLIANVQFVNKTYNKKNPEVTLLEN